MTPLPAPPADAVWTTPALLRLGMFAVWLASLLLLAASLGGALWDRTGLRVVGRELAPALRAAEEMHRSLAALDTAVQMEMRNGKGSGEALDLARQHAADAILSAAENVTEREMETRPLHQLSLTLSAYSAEVQKARDGRKTGDKRSAESFGRAATLMREQLLPVAGGLRSNIRKALSTAFERHERTAGILAPLVIGAAALLGAILVGLQLFLARRVRRILNPLLFCATAITLVFAVYAVDAFGREDAVVHRLKNGWSERAPGKGEEVKQEEWEREVKTGFQDVANIEWSAPAAALLIAALAALGVLPRLREYSS